MMKFRLLVTPTCDSNQHRYDAFRTWMQASGQAQHHQDETADAYLVDLDTLYPALLALRDHGIAATEFRVVRERASGRQPPISTTRALNRRVAAIEMAFLTVNDLHRLGQLAAEGDLRVIIDALLLLLRTTQQGLASVSPPACAETTGGKRR